MAIEITIIIFLSLLGVVLLLAEIFLLPGITVAGFAGALSSMGGVVYAFINVGTTAGIITLVVSILLFTITFVFLVKSNAMNRIALNTDIESKVDQEELKLLSTGDKGVTLSRLNPIGQAEFNGVSTEAKSVSGEYIDEGVPVVIVRVETYNVLVKIVEK